MKSKIENVDIDTERDKRMCHRIVDGIKNMDFRNEFEKINDVEQHLSIYCCSEVCIAYLYFFKIKQDFKFDEKVERATLDRANKLLEIFGSDSRIFTNKKEWRKYTKKLEKENDCPPQKKDN